MLDKVSAYRPACEGIRRGQDVLWFAVASFAGPNGERNHEVQISRDTYRLPQL